MIYIKIFFFVLIFILITILYMVIMGFNLEEFINYHINVNNNYCHKLEALIAAINNEKKEIRLPRHMIDKDIEEFAKYISYKLVKEIGFDKKYNERKIQKFLCNNSIIDFSKFFNDLNIKTKVIYVTRKNSLRRKIVNEEILIEFLKNKYKEQLKIIDLNSKYSIIDQAKIFNNCEIFITVHGAAVANLFFMKPNTTIIEILADGCRPHYFNLKAKKRNIKHYYLDLKDFNKSEDVYNYPRDSYMKIHSNDLNYLNQLLI